MWLRIACTSVLLIYSVGWGTSQTQNPSATKKQSPPKQKTETFRQKLLRVSGIAQSPSTLKGPGDEIDRGQIWIAEIAGFKARQLTEGGGFRSPVFIPVVNDLAALTTTKVVRVSLTTGKSSDLCSISGITKLIGFNLDDTDKALVLVREGSNPPKVAFLSITACTLEPLLYDDSLTEDRRMVEHLSAWDREYGNVALYVSQQTKSGMAGTQSWIDVFIRSGSGAPLDVSNCAGTNCGQPSLAPDGKLIAFIRANEE